MSDVLSLTVAGGVNVVVVVVVVVVGLVIDTLQVQP